MLGYGRSVDPLDDVLRTFPVVGSLAATVSAGEPWALAVPAVPSAALHAVVSGTSWITVEGRGPVRLQQGDVVVLPAGDAHLLGSGPEIPAQPYDVVGAQESVLCGRPWSVGTGPATTTLLCASYACSSPSPLSPLRQLPPLVHVSTTTGDYTPLDPLLRLLAHELRQPQPGGAVVLDRLVDVLLVHVLRAWLLASGAADQPPSWLGGLRDPLVAQLLQLVHDDPARAWSLPLLAAGVHASRATASRRFSEAVGVPVMTYLTLWRMDLAAKALRETDQSVEAVARSVGYASPFAFSRAFSRRHGVAPGRYRAAA